MRSVSVKFTTNYGRSFLKRYEERRLSQPAFLRRFSRDFLSLRGRQFVGAGFAALRSTELPQRDCGGIAVIGYGVGRLPCRNIADEFGECEWIAWTFSLPLRHAKSIAQSERRRIAKPHRISN